MTFKQVIYAIEVEAWRQALRGQLGEEDCHLSELGEEYFMRGRLGGQGLCEKAIEVSHGIKTSMRHVVSNRLWTNSCVLTMQMCIFSAKEDVEEMMRYK